MRIGSASFSMPNKGKFSFHAPSNPSRFANLLTQGVNQCSMFAVYDGHGGDDCCNYLKEQFHTYALENFSSKNMDKNLKTSALRLDKDFADKVM